MSNCMFLFTYTATYVNSFGESPNFDLSTTHRIEEGIMKVGKPMNIPWSVYDMGAAVDRTIQELSFPKIEIENDPTAGLPVLVKEIPRVRGIRRRSEYSSTGT